MLATVPHHCFLSGSGPDLNCCQIAGWSRQYTQTVNSNKVQWRRNNPSELGRLSVGCPAGPPGDSYHALTFAV